MYITGSLLTALWFSLALWVGFRSPFGVDARIVLTFVLSLCGGVILGQMFYIWRTGR